MLAGLLFVVEGPGGSFEAFLAMRIRVLFEARNLFGC